MEYHSADETKVEERLSELETRISAVAVQRRKLLAIYVKDGNMNEGGVPTSRPWH
jgi:hypothetical protein